MAGERLLWLFSQAGRNYWRVVAIEDRERGASNGSERRRGVARRARKGGVE